MNESDQQLVEQVTQMVVAALRQARTQTAATPRAPIHPPPGTCPPGTSRTPAPGNTASKTSGGLKPQTASPIALTGIVTAEQLQDAIDAAYDNKARLAPDARLTPLANDFARQHPEKIERVGATNNATTNQPAKANPHATFLTWSAGHCPAAQQISTDLRHRLKPSGATRSESGLIQAIRDLASGVTSKQLVGGVLFVETAALAACYANRSSHLRAVVATSQTAVEQAMAAIGANVLIIEYPRTSSDTMRQMVEQFTSQAPHTSPHVQRQLADLHRS